MVEEPSGRGDDDIHAGLERVELLLITHAAVDDGDGQVGEPRVVAERGLHLRGQFARRLQDDGTGGALVALKAREDGQGEGGGLAGARLGAADEVAAFEDERDGA